jgi:toxin YoeB
MVFKVLIEKNAQLDIEKIIRSGNKSDIKKLGLFLKELTINPFEGNGKPEQFKYELADYWSRRINKKDRLIYRVEDEIVTVIVVSALGHYYDK